MGQFGDLIRKRGREEQRLPFFRQDGNDPPQIGKKSHIHHSVGFIQHENLQLIEFHIALLHQIQQSSRGGNQKVQAMIQ